MESFVQRLKLLANDTAEGASLIATAAAARTAVSLARRRDELSTSILPEIDSVVERITGRQVSSFDDVTIALNEAELALSGQTLAGEKVAGLRTQVLAELELYIKDLKRVADLRVANGLVSERIADINKAIREVGDSRTQARTIADAASKGTV